MYLSLLIRNLRSDGQLGRENINIHLISQCEHNRNERTVDLNSIIFHLVIPLIETPSMSPQMYQLNCQISKPLFISKVKNGFEGFVRQILS